MSDEAFATAADFFASEDAKRGGRKIDEQATRIARNRHARGTARLLSLFGMLVFGDELPPPHVARVIARSQQFGDPTGRGTPVRLQLGCPPARDAEHQRKHERRKRAHESRRRNRGA